MDYRQCETTKKHVGVVVVYIFFVIGISGSCSYHLFEICINAEKLFSSCKHLVLIGHRC